jgi:PBP superfamily domain
MRAPAAALALAVLLLEFGVPAAAQELVVIVHPERSDAITLDQLAQIYLKKRRHWRGGEGIVPVNREAESREREAFARQVFSETAQQLSVYWNRQYFLGVLPPATLASDRAVLAFVAREQRAIGYVRASEVDASVRVVLRLRDEPVAGRKRPRRRKAAGPALRKRRRTGERCQARRARGHGCWSHWTQQVSVTL